MSSNRSASYFLPDLNGDFHSEKDLIAKPSIATSARIITASTPEGVYTQFLPYWYIYPAIPPISQMNPKSIQIENPTFGGPNPTRLKSVLNQGFYCLSLVLPEYNG